MGAVKFSVDAKQFSRDMQRVDMRLSQSGSGAEHILAIQIEKDTEPFVPARNKTLVNNTKVIDNVIIYPGPYAHYLYVGKLFIDPDTGSPWATSGATKVITGKDLNISTAVHSKAQAHWFEASKAQNLDKWRRVAGRAMQREFRR